MFWEFFTYSGYQFFITCVIFKYFLQVYGLYVHSLNSIFHRAQGFSSVKFQVFLFYVSILLLVLHYLVIIAL